MWKWVAILCLLISATMSAEIKVMVFAGSTRQDSVNKKLAFEAAELARHMGAEVTMIDLKDYPIPFYDQDLETTEGMPANAKRLRQLMIQSDVIMIASPNYNSSLSAVLKNVIDWVSRSEMGRSSREAFKGKKVILMSASPGLGGGAKGLKHLREIIEKIGGTGTVLPQQISVAEAHKAFDEDNHLKNEKIKMEIQQLLHTVMN